MKFGTELCGRI